MTISFIHMLCIGFQTSLKNEIFMLFFFALLLYYNTSSMGARESL